MKTPEEKRCKACGTIKAAREFYAAKNSADGLRSKCKPCFGAQTVECARRHRPQPLSFAARFGQSIRVAESGCWEWTGARTSSGYGQIQAGRRSASGNWSPEYAHRVSYEMHVGPIPYGLALDHLCRNRSCVNPTHLEPVTAAENTRRGISGDRNHNRKLTSADAREVRARYAAGGVTQEQLAAEHGMTQSAIGALVRGETWRNS